MLRGWTLRFIYTRVLHSDLHPILQIINHSLPCGDISHPSKLSHHHILSTWVIFALCAIAAVSLVLKPIHKRWYSMCPTNQCALYTNKTALEREHKLYSRVAKSIELHVWTSKEYHHKRQSVQLRLSQASYPETNQSSVPNVQGTEHS